MSEVRIYNDNIYTYKEKFREENIEIPPKGFIRMDGDIAIMFKGSYTPVVVDGGGAPDPRFFKMLRIVPDSGAEPEVKVEKFVCNACAKNFTTPVLLDKHITDEHAEQITDEDEREKRIKEKAGRK